MKSFLLFFATLLSIATFAQTKITGTVSDSSGKLPLANITIKNSLKGTFTNDTGYFSIEAKLTDTLQISYLGYQNKEVVVCNLDNSDILLDNYEKLDEVIIVGYHGTTTRCTNICCGYSIVEEYWYNRDNNDDGYKLYPNPSKNGVFNIKLLEDISALHIEVADLTGRIILSQAISRPSSSVHVDLSNQPTGIYIVNIFTNGERLTSKKAIRL
nr:carboxypeptidase-like regulatory domain-containing protein [uncultured Psychroserpens sp.]